MKRPPQKQWGDTYQPALGLEAAQITKYRTGAAKRKARREALMAAQMAVGDDKPTVEKKIPDGCFPRKEFNVKFKNGTIVSFVVPAGMSPGDTFRVPVPAPYQGTRSRSDWPMMGTTI